GREQRQGRNNNDRRTGDMPINLKFTSAFAAGLLLAASVSVRAQAPAGQAPAAQTPTGQAAPGAAAGGRGQGAGGQAAGRAGGAGGVAAPTGGVCNAPCDPYPGMKKLL